MNNLKNTGGALLFLASMAIGTSAMAQSEIPVFGDDLKSAGVGQTGSPGITYIVPYEEMYDVANLYPTVTFFSSTAINAVNSFVPNAATGHVVYFYSLTPIQGVMNTLITKNYRYRDACTAPSPFLYCEKFTKLP